MYLRSYMWWQTNFNSKITLRRLLNRLMRIIGFMVSVQVTIINVMMLDADTRSRQEVSSLPDLLCVSRQKTGAAVSAR